MSMATQSILGLFTYKFSSTKPIETIPDPEVIAEEVPEVRDELRDAIEAVFKTIKVDPTQKYFRDSKGKHFLGGYGDSMKWTKPLGKRLLIVDIDTRVPTDGNQILNPSNKIDWDTLQSGGTGLVSHAITNHYLYSLIHGYEYRYYQALNIPDHYPTWIRPHIFKQLLPDYDFIVAMDADVVVSHLEVPLEWMFNRWGIEEHTSMALPHDTEEFKDGKTLKPSEGILRLIITGKSISTDSKGVPVLNGGFIISRNNPLTFEMLGAWANCTTEARYPGCARWKGEWSHEQRAFSEYIRYDFGKVPKTIVGIPCDDAMGYPDFKKENEAKGNRGISDCNGNFVRHYTLGKDQVHRGGSASIAQVVAEVLQKSLLGKQDEYVIKETEPLMLDLEDLTKIPQPWELALSNETDETDPLADLLEPLDDERILSELALDPMREPDLTVSPGMDEKEADVAALTLKSKVS